MYNKIIYIFIIYLIKNYANHVAFDTICYKSFDNSLVIFEKKN